MKSKIPLLYLCIHKRFDEKFGRRQFTQKQFYEVVTRLYHVKKRFAVGILYEMEKFNLIGIKEKGRKGKISLKKNNVNLNDLSKIYRSIKKS